MPKSALQSWLLALGRVQTRRPLLVVMLVLATLLPAGYSASRLTLRTSFSELLPDEKPSVIELRRVNERTVGTNTLTVVAESHDTELLKRFVDELGPKLRTLPPEWVGGVDDGTRAVRRFFEEHKHLYADLKDVEQLHDDVLERYDYEVGKKTGLGLDLEDDADVPPPITADSLEKRFKKKADDAKASTPGVDGYYIGEDGHLAAILVRTPLGGSDADVPKLRARIGQLIDEGGYGKVDGGFRYHFTGNLITNSEQQQAVKDDLLHVGIWGIGGILAVTFLFFLRLRTLLAMGLTIGTGCVWAFGVAYLSVGYLNTATGFLASIIAGNGINFGIIYMARYIEARRDERLDVADSIATAHRETAEATLAAAAAAMVAYGSLSTTDFRGFKHFGIIGGAGMLLCWLATYLLLPAVLALSEGVRPMFHPVAIPSRLRGVYGVPFAWLSRKLPIPLALAGIALGLYCAKLSYGYFTHDPMEYDLANVRNERLSPTAAGTLSVRVDKVVGRLGQDGRAIVVDRLDQVEPLVAELERRRAAAPEKDKPFQKVVSVFSLLPSDQDRKIELITETLDRVDRARKRGFISDADWKKLEPELPRRLAKIGIDDLPELVARPFVEKDRSRGKIVYIVPSDGHSVYDAHYLMQWADAFREVKLPNGDIIRGSGDPVIFSDMLINVGEDAPRAIGLSFVGTLLVILIAFRGRAAGWGALATLVLGLLWLVGFLAFRDIKLNFLNFVALPISIGVGADYALNMMKRRSITGDSKLYEVVVETGGAVVLCSLTTTLGYLALLLSINRAVKSFGLAAAVGEVTTLLAAMLVLPAVLFWRASRRAKRSTT